MVKKIVIVEDEMFMREELQYILETLKEFSNKILTSSRLWYF